MKIKSLFLDKTKNETEVKTMKRFTGIMITMVAMFLIMVNVQNAHAFTMELIDPNNPSDNLIIPFSSPLNDSTTPGIIVYAGSFGGFTFTVDTGSTMPALGSATDPMQHLTVDFTSTSAGKMIVGISDTGYGPVSSPAAFETSVGGSINDGGYLQAQTYEDTTLFGLTTQLADIGPFSTGSFSQDASASVDPNNPFSLTTVVDLVATAGGEGGSIDVSLSPVPEPSTFVLLGLGLCGLPFLRKRIRSNS